MSVVLNNHGYGRFLRDAIDSALADGGDDVEVVVVDDGSTDCSRDVIASYGERVVPVLQEQQGQRIAIRRGVEAATGDLVLLLDSDDLFLPGKVRAVVDAFAEPDVVMVYHRLRLADAEGRRIPGTRPASVVRGDVADAIAAGGGLWPFPLTSSLAFRREALLPYIDIPPFFRVSSDAYLVSVVPFSGRVVGLDRELGLYRLHGKNIWAGRRHDDEGRRLRLEHWAQTAAATNRVLEAAGDPRRLDLRHHFEHRAVRRELGLREPLLPLLLLGLGPRGEPSRLRRLRRTARVLRDEVRRRRARP